MLGATTSDLVNSVFGYAITAKELPRIGVAEKPGIAQFTDFTNASTLDVEWPTDFDSNYKEIAEQFRLDEHEALA